jgi:hypothetical protein
MPDFPKTSAGWFVFHPNALHYLLLLYNYNSDTSKRQYYENGFITYNNA